MNSKSKVISQRDIKPTGIKANKEFSRKVERFMKPIVEFCQSNLGAGTERVKEILEQENKVDVVEYSCLGNCGDCYEYPYALVDGRFIAGKTPKDLLQKIRAEVERIYKEMGLE